MVDAKFLWDAMVELTFLMILVFVLWWLYRIAERLDKVLAEMKRQSELLAKLDLQARPSTAFQKASK